MKAGISFAAALFLYYHTAVFFAWARENRKANQFSVRVRFKKFVHAIRKSSRIDDDRIRKIVNNNEKIQNINLKQIKKLKYSMIKKEYLNLKCKRAFTSM